MLYEFKLKTDRENMHDITPQVWEAVQKSGIKDGTVTVFAPHTTAAITINENADPDVVHDMLIGLRHTYPDLPEYQHAEGNSTAHLKSSTLGVSETIMLVGGSLLLGTWQDIYFCEFDGPRNRHFYVRNTEEK